MPRPPGPGRLGQARRAGTPGGNGHLSDFAVDLRMWSDAYAPLDLEARPGGYRLWTRKAKAYLLGRHPQVGKALDWAERQIEPIKVEGLAEAARLLPGFDVEQVSGVLRAAVQRTISDQLRMTKHELAGEGLGLELWRLLVREHAAPEQPASQA